MRSKNVVSRDKDLTFLSCMIRLQKIARFFLETLKYKKSIVKRQVELTGAARQSPRGTSMKMMVFMISC